jgi:uncharacterized protein
MQIHLDQHPTANLITHVGPDGIRVGQHRITRSAIVSATALIPDWPVNTIEALDWEALGPALRLDPEILLLGTGARAVFPASSLFAELAGRGIGLEAMDTAAACRTYNVLVFEDRPVVAALILP